MLAGPKPRIFTFLSAAGVEEKGAMLVNLGASLVQAGRDVVLVDACIDSEGIAGRFETVHGATLLQVARQERALDEVVQTMPQGIGIAAMMRRTQRGATQDPVQMRRVGVAFELLAARSDIVMVDAELDKEDNFPIASLADGEIVVQVVNSPESIKTAYAIIKRIAGQVGRRRFGVLVTGASEKEAQRVYQNMAQAANRYLAVKLNSVGSVPADDHLKRAMRLDRAVVEAFPLAGASVAFRQLAGRFVLSDMAAAG